MQKHMQDAFEKMIEHNQGRIRYIASRYSKNSEFEDIYQEILLQLWRSFNSFDGKSLQSTWVYKVALNTACSFVRKVNRDADPKETNKNEFSDNAAQQCQADLLENFMDSLNDTDASILMMYLDGVTSEGTAVVLGISSNAVRSRMKRIKQAFEKRYIEDDL